MSQYRRSTRRVYEGRFFQVDLDLVGLPNGRTTELEMIRHPGASAVVPILDDGRIRMIRQFRYAAEGFILEVPAGKLDRGESPAQCAAREVREEAGVIAGTLVPLGFIFTTPGFTDEKIHLFAATGLTPAPQELDDDEVIETVDMTLEQALALAANGGIRDGKTLCALWRTEQEVRAGRLKLGSGT